MLILMHRYSNRLYSVYQRPEMIYILVSLFLFLASVYSVVVPPYEAPDEVGHFGYILHLHETKMLPVQESGVFGSAQHPPLYYLIAAIFSLPAGTVDNAGAYRPNPAFMWRDGGGDEVNISQHFTEETFPYQGRALMLHLARLASVVMGAGTVVFVFLIGKKIFPTKPEIGALAATLVAFNPQFLFISGAINNDNLLTFSASGLCFHLLCAIKGGESTKYWFLVGLWLGVATMAKVNGLLFAAIVGIFLLVGAWRHSSLQYSSLQWGSLQWLIRNGLAVGLPLVIVSGWWFVRNAILYGDLLGWAVYMDVFSVNMRKTSLNTGDLRHFFATQYNSFWGRFGWMNIWSPTWFYLWIRSLIGFAIVGITLFAIRPWRTLSQFQQTALVALLLTVFAYEGYMLWAITKFNDSWYQGRYIFPIIGPLMIFMSIGILTLIADRFRAKVCLFLFVTQFAIALYMPLYVIGPAYQMVTQPKWQAWLLPHKTEYRFGETILLRGYDVETNDSQIVLNLYWQARQSPDFNYAAFVHLLDEDDNILVQDDHAPGEPVGYPPKVWNAGDIVIGRYELDWADPSSSGAHRFRVGLYNWETGQRLDVRLHDESIGDYVILE